MSGWVAGAVVVGGYLQSEASRDAADTMQDASNREVALQREMWQQGREDLAPWRQAGESALTGMQNMMSGDYDISTDPAYQFRMQQGLQGVESSAAGRGSLFSGNTLKELTGYGQGLASQEYGNRFNRLASLAGLGQTATGQGVTIGQNYANQAGNAMYNAGQARASGYMGQANAYTNALNQGAYAYGQYNQPNTTQWGTTPGSQQSQMLAAQW